MQLSEKIDERVFETQTEKITNSRRRRSLEAQEDLTPCAARAAGAAEGSFAPLEAGAPKEEETAVQRQEEEEQADAAVSSRRQDAVVGAGRPDRNEHGHLVPVPGGEPAGRVSSKTPQV